MKNMGWQVYILYPSQHTFIHHVQITWLTVTRCRRGNKNNLLCFGQNVPAFTPGLFGINHEFLQKIAYAESLLEKLCEYADVLIFTQSTASLSCSKKWVVPHCND